MSSAKRRLERNSPSVFTPLFSQFNLLNMLSNVAVNSLVFTPLFSQFNLLNMLSNVAVNSLGEMLTYFSLDPDFLTLFVQMYCH